MSGVLCNMLTAIPLFWVITASTSLQCIAFMATMVVGLKYKSGPLIIFGVAFGIMAFRRLLSMWIHLKVTDLTNVSGPPELTAVLISLLLVIGSLWEHFRNAGQLK